MSGGPHEQTGRVSSLRWLSILMGLALIAVAVVAATRVENSRQGLIAEVITYLGGLTGLVLLFYGLFARPRRSAPVSTPSQTVTSEPKVATANDLVLGVVGIVLAILLLGGIAITAGLVWAGFGLILLTPMLAGSAYLSLRFLRAPYRDWRVDLRPFRQAASQKKDADRDQNQGPHDVPVDKPDGVGEEKQPSNHEDHTQRE